MKYSAYLTKNSAWPLVSIKSTLIIIIDVIVFPAPAPHPGGSVGVAERAARKAAGQCPARRTGRVRVWPGLALCISACSAPRASSCPNTGRAPEEDSQGAALGKAGCPQCTAGGSGPCLLSCSPGSFLPSACLLYFPAAVCCGGLATQWTRALEPQMLPEPQRPLRTAQPLVSAPRLGSWIPGH